MLKFEIDGQEQEFSFGMKFIRELDKAKEGQNNGLKFGVGLQYYLASFIQDQNPLAVAEILLAANHAAGGKLTTSKLDKFFDEEADYEKVTSDVMDQLEQGKFTSQKVAVLTAQMAAAKAKAQAEANN